MKFAILFYIGFSLIVWSGIAAADAPPLVNYRGHFDGPPAVPDQPVSQSLVFSLYNSMTATEPLWTETQQVSIFDGNFAVLLGSVTPLSADMFIEPIRYIGVKTETGPELMRQQIISVPYAMRADAADVATSAENAKMADAAITAATADTATKADSATVAETALKTNQFGNFYTAPNGNIGYNWTDSKFMLTLGSGLGNTKLALWDNNDISIGMGIQAGQYRFHVAHSGDRFSFLDRPYPTFRFRGKTDSNFEDRIADLDPSQIIFDPDIGLLQDPIELFTIQGSGLVGIGIINPQHALDVAGNIRASGAYLNSDFRLKKNIKTLDESLDHVLRLRGVEYDWKTDEFQDRRFNEGKQIGLIAQEVEQVLPELVSTDQDDYKSVDYSRLVPVLVEAIKTQQQQIQLLRAEIEAIKQSQ